MEARLKLSKINNSPPIDATLYRSIIGSLRYLVNTRPDLAYSVGFVSNYMKAPITAHMAAVKQILRYVKDTINYGCYYTHKKDSGLKLIGYSDSDFACDINDRKSITGVSYFLRDNPITWVSQKQKVVALSSCEAEYMARTAGVCQGVWLARLLSEMQWKKQDSVVLKIDNKFAIAITNKPNSS